MHCNTTFPTASSSQALAGGLLAAGVVMSAPAPALAAYPSIIIANNTDYTADITISYTNLLCASSKYLIPAGRELAPPRPANAPLPKCLVSQVAADLSDKGRAVGSASVRYDDDDGVGGVDGGRFVVLQVANEAGAKSFYVTQATDNAPPARSF